MKFVLSASFLLMCITASPQLNSWRGITPVRSTCEDVKKILKVDTCSLPLSEYMIPDYRVKIVFANDDCDRSPHAWRVPKGTLLSLTISPLFSGGEFGNKICSKMPAGTLLAVLVKFKRPQPLKNFRFKNQKEILFDPSSPPNHGYKGYYYPEEGFIISSVKEGVVTVVYVAEQKDLHLCPEYYEDPKGFVEVGIYP